MESTVKRKGFFYTAVMAAMILSGQSTQVMAAITADSTQLQQPKITTLPSKGVLVDINAPSSSGLSHNIFSDFDVTKQGVVLNNSGQNIDTQLAGMIEANQYLNGKSATIILNEINGGKASNLKGMVEVAGQKAQVIIANPAGIVCSGCGFINTQRTTLTTGKPQVTQGILGNYQVDGGKVAIKGEGLKDSSSSYNDIITDMLSVSAGLKVNNLRIITGRNAVDNETLSIEKTGKNSNWVNKKVAIDVTSLGGIQAGTIMMVATEEGFGVKNAGEIKTTLSDLSLTNAGYLKNSGIIDSAGDLSVIISGELENHGIINNIKNQKISTNNNKFVNTGEIKSGGDLAISSGKLINKALISSMGDMAIDTGKKSLENGVNIFPAQIRSNGNITITAANIDNINNALIYSKENTTVRSGYINNQRSKFISEGTLKVEARSLSNFMGGLYSTDDMDLDIAEITMNSSGITSGRDLKLNAKWVDSRMGAVQAEGKATITVSDSYANSSGVISVGELDLTTKKLSNYAGLIVTTRDLTINAENVDNRYMSLYSPTFGIWVDNLGVDGGIISGEHLTLNTNNLNNLQSRVLSRGDMLVTAGYVDNTNGKLSANHYSRLEIDHLQNQYGSVKAGESLYLLTFKLSGTKGAIEAHDDLELNVNAGFTNNHTIIAGNDITFNVDGGFHNWSTIKAGNNIDINANQIGNYLFNMIYAGNNLNLNASGMIFNLGWMGAKNSVNRNTRSVFAF